MQSCHLNHTVSDRIHYQQLLIIEFICICHSRPLILPVASNHSRFYAFGRMLPVGVRFVLSYMDVVLGNCDIIGSSCTGRIGRCAGEHGARSDAAQHKIH